MKKVTAHEIEISCIERSSFNCEGCKYSIICDIMFDYTGLTPALLDREKIQLFLDKYIY